MLVQLKNYSRRDYLVFILVCVLLIIGFLLRYLQLEEYPLTVNQDELSNIYDGYSIARTGADRWGEKYPVILRAFGNMDYRPPMYAWLCAIPIELFGYSIYSGRLVSVVLGFVSLLLIYLVGEKMGGRLFGLLALLLATFSPWHIVFSRVASEGTMLPPFFLICSCYLWQKAQEKGYSLASLAWLGLSIGLGTNTYQAGKLTFFLFTLLVLIDLWRYASRFFQKALVLGISALVGAGPQLIAAVTMPDRFLSRADGSMMEFSWSFQYFNTLFKNIALNLSPDFLFFNFGVGNYFTVARLLMIECLFFYLGMFLIHKVVSKNQAIKPAYIYALLFMAVLPSALTRENPHALRASGLTVLLPLLSAAGIVLVYKHINNAVLRNAFVAVTVGLALWNAKYFLQEYTASDTLIKETMPALTAKGIERLNNYKDWYDTVVLDKTGDGSQMYLYVASYCGMTPEEFQRAEKRYDAYGWDEFKQLGKYHFLNQSELDELLQKTESKVLIMTRTRHTNYTAVDSVELPGEKMYIYSSGPAQLLSKN
ncbi:glycosyltransferase family 39 protein [Hymenobacter sp. 15J16-1T3B]|uniref:ArnT family glycosyltransferase n=1 Tax=Hymenobacter sp. 15J16-1T3B TaxID=2886941 RepID=UPI001D121169|nr:glycosyltransferase family 39 protein [Hymenobacter sp. 15J16-1T3B]MCC3157223.1 glycosyltransferase family 39 protein [Hymenobacter sp. 15J16-1T3B]